MDISLEGLSTTLVGAAGFIVAFGLAVFVHELGHFLAAKLFKVPVERFVIGFDREAMPFMPRCIWERKIGETTYGLSLVPLGGYVKMTGTVHPEIEKYLDGEPQKKDEAEAPKAEDGADASESDVKMPGSTTLAGQAMQDMAALYRKPFWQKTIIYCAGVTMNLILAMGIVATMNVRGQLKDAPRPAVVAWQGADSLVAKEHGVREGDRIVAVDGKPVATDEEYEEAVFDPIPWIEPLGFLSVLSYLPDDYVRDVTVTFDREGKQFDAAFSFDPDGSGDAEADKRSGEVYAALYNLPTKPANVGYVMRNKPAAEAGLQVGDIIASIGGEPISDWYEMYDVVSKNPGNSLDFEVYRDGATREFAITPEPSAGDSKLGLIGIMPGMANPVRDPKPVLASIAESPGDVANRTVAYALNLKKIFGKLFTGHFRQVREDLGGPVAIAQMAGYHANLGLDRFLQFMLMLNIALAVMNILPLPILDGGHVVLAAWEGLFGKPMSPRVLVPVLNGATVALLGFVVIITVSDLLKIVWK